MLLADCYFITRVSHWAFLSISNRNSLVLYYFLCKLLFPLKQTELAQKEDLLDLLKNDEHPQFHLIKVSHSLFLIFLSMHRLTHLLLQKEVNKSRNRELVQLFDFGVGIHHAGMLRSDRNLTERLFSDGLLKVILYSFQLSCASNIRLGHHL